MNFTERWVRSAPIVYRAFAVIVIWINWIVWYSSNCSSVGLILKSACGYSAKNYPPAILVNNIGDTIFWVVNVKPTKRT